MCNMKFFFCKILENGFFRIVGIMRVFLDILVVFIDVIECYVGLINYLRISFFILNWDGIFFLYINFI